MKRLLIFTVFAFLSYYGLAQIMTPVKWEFEIKQLSSHTFELIVKADIQKPWHLYGQYFEKGGPVQLVFDFEKNNNYELIGNTVESPKPHIVKDEIFGIDVQYFSEAAVFTQKIKISGETEIKLNVEGQVCNDDTGICIMVSGEHTFTLK